MASHPQVKALEGALRNARQRTMGVGGLCCSSAPLFFAALSQGKSAFPTLLFVMDDADTAGYFYHDLVQMMGEADVLLFPSSYRRAIRYNQRDAASEILRTEVLGRVGNSSQSLYVVTYPEALAEKVVPKSELAARTLTLRQGATIDFARLESWLDEQGFARVDYVYEPGQYALRGSIVDVYSFSSESPFRIDFFGDEVESIRTFDVQTQLSERKVGEVVVVPEMTEGETSYISVFDFFPSDTVLVTRNAAFVCDRVAQIASDGFSAQAMVVDAECEPFRRRVVDSEVFVRGIASLRKVLLGGQQNDAQRIVFDTSAQPLFHKNLELLQQECRRFLADGYKLCILADSAKQIERLRDMLAEGEGSDAEYETRPIVFEAVQHTIHEGFVDHTLKLCLFTDHQIFDRFHKYSLKSDKARRGKVALTLREIQQFDVGDYIVHIDHGIGRFGGLVRIPSGDAVQEMIKITYQNEDAVYVSIHSLHKISKYKGKEGEPPRVSKLGTGAWERMKERVKTKVKDIARDLIRLYAERQKEKGFPFSKDSYMQSELEASFLYEDTPDQLKATQDVKADMEKPQPMDRLVCGDVGFGKTEVAVRAAFKAAADSKQTAVLVPTTVLAYQHYKTFSQRLKGFPVRVDYLSRARSAKEQRELLKDLAEGRIDIIVGTHKLIGKGVKFKDLGLLVIDEEQKFGVGVKEKLRQMKVNVDTLTMTATPIPRTLQFSLMGARDLSVIQTPPPNRYPIQTEIHTFSPEVIAEAINFEMSRNGQVFFVNNKISNLPQLADTIRRVVPDARVCIAHGRMDPKELEKIILDFMNYDYDVLLSTTIVENGIDVPNANTIIVNSAQNYGLSDLHQMRGRVGRSNKKAFCYLMAPPLSALPDDSRRRLQALENFADLGSGLHIAMQDLDIRGAGNMLGAEQSGFIADLGYETYQKVLAEAMQELRHEQAAALPAGSAADSTTTATQPGEGDAPPAPLDRPVPMGVGLGVAGAWEDTAIESDIPAYYPETYVPSSSERMSLYRELDNLASNAQLDAYRARLIDRFGQLPPEAEELLRVMPLKWAAGRLGIERLTLKQQRMVCFLPGGADSPYYQSDAFGRVIAYATRFPRRCRLRDDAKRSLLIHDVPSVQQALQVLTDVERG